MNFRPSESENKIVDEALAKLWSAKSDGKVELSPVRVAGNEPESMLVWYRANER